MKRLSELITEELKAAFKEAGYPEEKVTASLSNRPDLCEYQCNGAMALAKELHKAPLEIAENVCEVLKKSEKFALCEAVKPGFINIILSDSFLSNFISGMKKEEKFGFENPGKSEKIIIDYGGPNVAKPLHVGHLRSAIIGESVKRICAFAGHDVTGDIHLGDWGLQIGQIIAKLQETNPDLPYFDDSFEGEYPEEAPFTISQLEEIYPAASKKCKEDPEFAKKAHLATAELQAGRRGYLAIWKHVMNVSKADLKKNYDNLDVHFELWKGESDVQKYIPGMIEKLKEDKIAVESEGALVIDVSLETDKKEIPPCIILKSDGATLYATTDIATLLEREELFKPGSVIYVVDKRQSLHLEQVFRASKKAGIVPESTRLYHLGFGTMNGKDGQPYKTREGGVMRLESLINEINDAVYEKMKDNPEIGEEEAKATSKIIALAALKYGDLSNQAAKDYIFDVGRFIEFEGNTGPYILYTIVRIKSILSKAGEWDEKLKTEVSEHKSQKDLMLVLARFSDVMLTAYNELAPHKICAYIYELSNAFNSFYHEVKILSEADCEKRTGYLNLLVLTRDVLEQSINLLGFAAPERM